MVLLQGVIAPSDTRTVTSGTISLSSKNSSTPSPSQTGQAPKGALNENSRGSISGMVKPDTGQANFSENTIRSGSPSAGAVSSTAIPSARFSAVRKLSASRVSMPPRTTIRSTTTSMSWRSFLSSAGTSSISKNCPSTLTR